MTEDNALRNIYFSKLGINHALLFSEAGERERGKEGGGREGGRGSMKWEERKR